MTKTVESIVAAIEYEPLELAPDKDSSPLFVGIDVAKKAHVAGFVSAALIAQYGRFEKCPVLVFENSRAGFEQLLLQISARCREISSCTVLLESTGHYHKALAQYLLEAGVQLYIMHVLARPDTHHKTDKRDALSLANHIYNQVALGIQLDDKARLARPAIQPNDTALRLRGLVQHRYELAHEIGRRRNKLTSILDELFPEFTKMFADPNLPIALGIRERFATPRAMSEASLAQLREGKTGSRPADAKLLQLQALARDTIGSKNTARCEALVTEQGQLIRELRMLQEHQAILEEKIQAIVRDSREGQILTSIAGVSPAVAAAAMAHIGHINNFANAGALKKFFGWSPTIAQTGTTLNHAHLDRRSGSRIMKSLIFMCVLSAIKKESPWKSLYDRLVKRKCNFDEKLQRYRGKRKVIGRVAGQLIEVMWFLLKKDADLLASIAPGEEPPPPTLYDAKRHAQDMARGKRGRQAAQKAS